MKKLALWMVLVAGASVGCGTKATGKPAGSCKEAVATSMKMVSQRLADDVRPEKLADATKLVGDAQLQACVDDKWPAAAIACLSAAKDTKALLACEPSMGSANQSLAKVMTKIGPELFAMMKEKAPAAPPAPSTP